MQHPIPVTLSETDRASLQTFIHAGKASARVFARVYALLKAADGWTDEQICEAFGISRNTSIKVRRTYLKDGKLVAPHADVWPPQPPAPGQAERIDYEYERLGTANLFFMVEPLTGWRHVEMTERRTKRDYAECLRWLVDTAYPEAEYVRLVHDNLNTHTPAALYEVFPPEEARRIVQRLEFHYTPKHASWLNMAEIEISIFQRACLSRRVESMGQLRTRINEVELERNRQRARSPGSLRPMMRGRNSIMYILT